MMKRTAWVILLLLILGPCAKADTFDATSGFYQPIGGTANNVISLSGDGFTAIGTLQIAPFGCRMEFAPGQPITGCESNWVGGLVIVTTATTQIPISFNFNFMLEIDEPAMTPPGSLGATLTETAEWGGFIGCINAIDLSGCQLESVLFPNDIVTLTMQVQQITDPNDQEFGGYIVTSEQYDIVDSTVSTPEPSSLILLGLGFAALAIYCSRDIRTRSRMA
jgi:hypothetical protein